MVSETFKVHGDRNGARHVGRNNLLAQGHNEIPLEESPQAELEVIPSFSLVLLRRLLFRASPGATQPHSPHLTLYYHLSSNTLSTLKWLLFSSLLNEHVPDVCKKAVDTITNLANQEMARVRPWHAVQAQACSMAQAQTAAALRESAFRVFAGRPNLVLDLQTEAVLGVFQRELQDTECTSLARSPSPNPSSKAVYEQLIEFLTTITPLGSSHPNLFSPHLQAVLSFLPQLTLLKSTLALPQQSANHTPWSVLGGMGELDEAEDINVWLNEDPSVSSGTADDSPPTLYEQSLDRIACVLGGRAVLPPAFEKIPSMLASYDWRTRHAGLMVIAAIAEGTGKVMLKGNRKNCRSRNAHVQGFTSSRASCCIGQLCTDLEEVMQEQYHQQLFAVLIPTLEYHEPRVHSHVAFALINFCEGVEHSTLIPTSTQ
ncbi:hypothetical protein NP233_g10377 [Leucocoprinus birnbaumii]|uniref:Uncharacterized protein n=1 Tax=Leucocoprinus birnbaumii TaxID=56174 RepID=A0AAD5YM82_9AGAR|nr:hypothetical protein NP233_g10377 [Leucocoprinus birnbaumii]